MKIAFFADNFYPELSGIADTISLTGAELARRGHEIHFFVPRYSAKDYEIAKAPRIELFSREKNILIHRMRSFKYPTPTMQGRSVIPRLFAGFFSKEKFDILHTHSFFGPGLDAFFYSRIKKIPLVGTNHTIIEEFMDYSPIKAAWMKEAMRKYVRWYYSRCKKISTPSNFLANDMRDNGFKVPSEVISNPIAPEFYGNKMPNLKEKFGFKPFTTLYAGRISEEKGVLTLFDAFIPFAKKNPEVGLVLVGQGTLRKILEKKAKESAVSSQITFRGPFWGEQKKDFFDIFRACDLFVAPSRAESQCMSMFQAMASGTAVIGANAAAIPEFITSERGLLFTPGNARELEARLDAIYKNPKLRSDLSKNAESFAKNFSVDQIANKWENFYSEVVSQYGK
ncbi:glycosyltransferase [Candidatus Giovannonibacteria bacterium]|nr:glycosyltransferase [Candidatus Giovannonibacteria bacterium]